MRLPNGHYRTAAGSEMTISGEHGGRSQVDFDWLEEGACPDCLPDAYEHDGMLIWRCDVCGGGQAALQPVVSNEPDGPKDTTQKEATAKGAVRCTQCQWVGNEEDLIFTDFYQNKCEEDRPDAEPSCPSCLSTQLAANQVRVACCATCHLFDEYDKGGGRNESNCNVWLCNCGGCPNDSVDQHNAAPDAKASQTCTATLKPAY